MTRCGYVAIAGRPNVGKSTLMNSLIGQKLSITAHKPQTTRHTVRGINTTEDAQVIYVDTPGIHQRKSTALNKVLNRSAVTALQDVDLIVLVVEAGSWTKEDQLAYDKVCQSGSPFLIAVNKVDLINNKQGLLPFLAQLPSSDLLCGVVPVSARKGDQLKDLASLIVDQLPVAAFIYSADQLTDVSERFLAAEIVREKLTRQLDAELPYALTVEIEQFLAEGSLYRINAVIWVERKGQKGIVVGKNGARLKEVGTQARKAMQHLFGTKVHLELWVKVKENWVDDARALRSLGYEQPQ